MSFDSLTFACRLKAAGVPEAEPEAPADANREMFVQGVAIKDDIAGLRGKIEGGVVFAAGFSVASALIRFH